MAKSPKRPSVPGGKSGSRSGATGGPSTSAGLNFQVELAMIEVLDLMSRALVTTVDDAVFSLEPRVLHSVSVETRWDVGKDWDAVTEIKLAPTRKDVVEWLERIGATTNSPRVLQFRLLHGRGSVPLMDTIAALRRLAQEASGDEGRLRELAAFEGIDGAEEVFSLLGAAPDDKLLRTTILPYDRERLEADITRVARYLVGEPRRQQLCDLLFRKLHKGVEHRISFHISNLIKEVEAEGIKFLELPVDYPSDLPAHVSAAVFLLQCCERGLPLTVVSAGASCSEAELQLAFAPYMERGILAFENDLVTLHPFKPRRLHAQASTLAAAALPSLVEFIRANRKSAIGWSQVPSALALARLCGRQHREIVAGLFRKLDKLLKRTGNKRFVLEVADLSIAAARAADHSEEVTRSEAVALVCGRSWVYQRRGRLKEARVEGEKSLEIGEAIGWKRNTAFCLKCIGRLFRLEAEEHRRTGTEVEARKCLAQSVDRLKRAIACFTDNADEIGTDASTEVGDCQSLLARTYLEAGETQQAWAAAREAAKLIEDELSKDYADLQIVLGDLEFIGRNVDAAVSFYKAAIRVADTADAEKSEIAARAWFRMGIATKSNSCLDKAADIWTSLDEDENVAIANWHKVLLNDGLSAGTIKILEREHPAVRVEAVRLHKERVKSAGAARGRRAEAPVGYWIAQVQQAKHNVTVQHKDW
jgi:hypothetical protein